MRVILKLLTLIVLSIVLYGCGAAREGFTLKKKDSAEEFLVEKKNPLVLPPEYGKLPLPDSGQIQNKENEKDIKELLTSSSNDNLNDNNASSLEESILKKID